MTSESVTFELEKFGSAYTDYKSKVPAMFPTLNPYTQGEKWPFSLKRLIDSKEHKPLFWVIIMIILFHLKTRIMVEHKILTTRSWTLVTIVVVLIMLDVIYEFNKKKIHA